MQSGKIILLNGSSSAGKTTLAIALQQLLPEPWQHIALDQFRDGLPGRYRGLNSPPGTAGARGLNVVPITLADERVTDVQFGDIGERMLKGMRRAIAAFAAQGNNVIIDDLLFEADYLHDYIVALEGRSVWFVGVRCSRAVVNERESRRPGRFPGTATSHFDRVHTHGSYDIEVDTSASSPLDCARAIISALDRPPGAFAAMRAGLSR
ncbi:MAG: AAA family ATPase [Gammaproteobacteria bacterium]|nr:AAA family ATPase [Gammaproteobacteria bacterium]